MKLQWLLGAALCFAGAANAQDDGKALFQHACAKCHGLSSVMRERNTRGRWAAVVDDMITRGADVSDADFEKLVDYLTKNLGPKVNVNKAAAEDLSSGAGFSKEAAAAIAAYRQKNGSFKSLDDLKKVPSIDAADIDSKKERLEVTADR